jgi:hypothetical protein
LSRAALVGHDQHRADDQHRHERLVEQRQRDHD